MVRAVEPELREIRKELAAAQAGPLYFPFAFTDTRPVRAAQGYLVKFPAAIVRAVPELVPIPQLDGRRPSPNAHHRRRPRVLLVAVLSFWCGYLADVRVELAIERHAVDWMMRYYTECGYEVRDVGSTELYDICASRSGHELHIEVKAHPMMRTAWSSPPTRLLTPVPVTPIWL